MVAVVSGSGPAGEPAGSAQDAANWDGSAPGGAASDEADQRPPPPPDRRPAPSLPDRRPVPAAPASGVAPGPARLVGPARRRGCPGGGSPVDVAAAPRGRPATAATRGRGRPPVPRPVARLARSARSVRPALPARPVRHPPPPAVAAARVAPRSSGHCGKWRRSRPAARTVPRPSRPRCRSSAPDRSARALLLPSSPPRSPEDVQVSRYLASHTRSMRVHGPGTRFHPPGPFPGQ